MHYTRYRSTSHTYTHTEHNTTTSTWVLDVYVIVILFVTPYHCCYHTVLSRTFTRHVR